MPPLHDRHAARQAALAAAQARLRGSGTAEPEPAPAPWVQPSDKQDADARRALHRLIDRGIVRDNGYRQSAEAVETLARIGSNILEHPDEARYRSLKATNAVLVNKVLAVAGAKEYLVAMGFRSQTVDFQQHYVLQPTLRRLHDLGLAVNVLNEHMEQLRERAKAKENALANAKADEEARKARALAEIDQDRDQVKMRLAREKASREQRELLANAAKEKEESEQAQGQEIDAADDDDGDNDRPAHSQSSSTVAFAPSRRPHSSTRGHRDYRPRETGPDSHFAYLSQGQRLGDPRSQDDDPRSQDDDPRSQDDNVKEADQ